MSMYNEDEDNISAADEILNQLEEGDENLAPDDETLNWAVQRIEEANLFKYLLVTPIFTNDSAAPEIVQSVNAKLQRFAMEELKELLGGAKERKVQQEVTKQFTDDEAGALKILAGKVLEKTGGVPTPPEERTPNINPINASNARTIGTNAIAVKNNGPQKTNNPTPPARKATPVSGKKQTTKKISTAGMSAEEVKKVELVEKNKNRRVAKSPIQGIPQPVNNAWAASHAKAGAQHASQSMNTSKVGLTDTLIGLELATPQTTQSSSGGEGVDAAIQFDPDQQ